MNIDFLTINSRADRLFELFTRRQIEAGKQLINEEESLLCSISASDPGVPRLFWGLSDWAEYSELAAETARRLASAYSQGGWPTLSLVACASIEVGLAGIAFYESRYRDAEKHCQWVYDNAHRLGDNVELLASADFINARSRRRRADYPSALEFTRSACRRYDAAGLPGMVAVMKPKESWLLTQLGDAQGGKKSWEEAYAYLKDTDDWTILGNLWVSKGRWLSRAGLEEEAESAFQEAITLYSKCKPPHRNLRRALTELANLEHRRAAREASKDRARALQEVAADCIRRAEALLASDPADVNNTIRLLLARVNQALNGPFHSLANARHIASKAYEFASEQKEKNPLMIARTRHKQAVLECRAAALPGCEDPCRLLLLACRYGTEALDLTRQTHNHRLAARIHTSLGNAYLDLFRDAAAATRAWEAALQCMAPHQDDHDYVVKGIEALGNRLSLFDVDSNYGVIFTVTDSALNQRLESAIQAAEQAIVLTAVDLLGPNAHAISKVLRTGPSRIEKHLSATRRKSANSKPDANDVIFRITKARAFSQPLEQTMQDLERAIILVACMRYDCNETEIRKRFHISHDRFQRHYSALERELSMFREQRPPDISDPNINIV